MPKHHKNVFVLLRINPGIIDPRSLQVFIQHALKTTYGDSGARYDCVDVLSLDPQTDRDESKGKRAVLPNPNRRTLPPPYYATVCMPSEMLDAVSAALTVTMFPPTIVANYPIAVDVLKVASNLEAFEVNEGKD